MGARPNLKFERLQTATSIYSNLAVVHAGVRPVIYDRLRKLEPPLGPGEYAVLRRLALTSGALSVVELTDFLAISRASARQIIGRLADGDLISSSPGASDRRTRLWSATPGGTALGTTQLPDVDRSRPLVAALQELSSAVRQMLSDDLDTLINGLDEAAGSFERGVSVDAVGSGTDDLSAFGSFFDLWLKIARAYRRIRAEQTRFFLQETNQVVDTAAYMALYRVHETPGGMAELASFLRVDQNTVTRLVDRLESHDLIRRMRNPSSRRELILLATDKGARLLEALARCYSPRWLAWGSIRSGSALFSPSL